MVTDVWSRRCVVMPPLYKIRCVEGTTRFSSRPHGAGGPNGRFRTPRSTQRGTVLPKLVVPVHGTLSVVDFGTVTHWSPA